MLDCCVPTLQAQQSISAEAAMLSRPSLCLQTNKVAVRYHPEFRKLLKYISITAPVSARPLLELPLLAVAGLPDY